MNENAVRVIWKWIAPTVFLDGVLGWAHAVGAPVASPLGLGYNSPRAVIFSLPLLALLFIPAYWLASTYASTKLSQSWQHRIPLYFFDPKDVDPSSKGGTIIQLTAFISFPAYPHHSVKMSSRYGIGSVRTAA